MKRILAALLLLLAPNGMAESPAWIKGERLFYDINWGFVTAGEAELRTRPVVGDSNSIELLSLAHNNGVFESMYRVADTVSTIVDRSTFLPSRFTKVLHEGGWHNSSHVDFLGGKARLSDTVFTSGGKGRKAKRSSDTTVILDGPTHAVTSAFYMFRTLDLKPGESREFLAVSGKKKYKLKVLCHRYERVEVEAGKFDCIVVEPILDDDGLFKAKGKLTIWLTRDSRRLPVLVESKIAVGSIKVELKKIAPN